MSSGNAQQGGIWAYPVPARRSLPGYGKLAAVLGRPPSNVVRNSCDIAAFAFVADLCAESSLSRKWVYAARTPEAIQQPLSY